MFLNFMSYIPRYSGIATGADGVFAALFLRLPCNALSAMNMPTSTTVAHITIVYIAHTGTSPPKKNIFASNALSMPSTVSLGKPASANAEPYPHMKCVRNKPVQYVHGRHITKLPIPLENCAMG